MSKTRDEKRAAGEAGHAKHHSDLAAFHQREADKYAGKADALEQAGKGRAAARQRKVAERNARLADEHRAKLAEGYSGHAD